MIATGGTVGVDEGIIDDKHFFLLVHYSSIAFYNYKLLFFSADMDKKKKLLRSELPARFNAFLGKL